MYPYRNLFTGPTLGAPMDAPYKNILFGSPDDEENLFDHRPQAPVAQNTPASFVDVYKELMGRQSGPAMAAYAKFLQAAPKESDYKPSKMTRLGAILSGAAAGLRDPATGFETARAALERPYERALKKYSLDAGRLREAANLEEGQFRNQIGTLKTVSDISNQQADNERQARAAEILNQSRVLGMEKTRKELQLIGIETHINPEDGHLIGINKVTGQTRDYGKIGQSSQDRITESGKKAERAGEISLKNTKSRILFETPIIEGRQNRLEDKRFEHSKEMERERQVGREKLAQERNKIKASVTKELSPGDVKVIRANRAKVQSLIDADPNKYAAFYDKDTGRLTGEVPEIGTDEYEAYRELYNALYSGTNSLASGKKVGKYGVTR